MWYGQGELKLHRRFGRVERTLTWEVEDKVWRQRRQRFMISLAISLIIWFQDKQSSPRSSLQYLSLQNLEKVGLVVLNGVLTELWLHNLLSPQNPKGVTMGHFCLCWIYLVEGLGNSASGPTMHKHLHLHVISFRALTNIVRRYYPYLQMRKMKFREISQGKKATKCHSWDWNSRLGASQFLTYAQKHTSSLNLQA